MTVEPETLNLKCKLFLNLYQPLIIVKNRSTDAVRQNRAFIFQN